MDDTRLEKLYQQLEELESAGKPVPKALLDEIAALEEADIGEDMGLEPTDKE